MKPHTYTTVLRSTTYPEGSPVTQGEWLIQAADDEAGLTITQVYFGDDLKATDGLIVDWDYAHSYEIEHKVAGICVAWWPVLHKPIAANQPASHELFIGVANGQVAGFYSDNNALRIKSVTIDSSDLDGLQEIEYSGVRLNDLGDVVLQRHLLQDRLNSLHTAAEQCEIHIKQARILGKADMLEELLNS